VTPKRQLANDSEDNTNSSISVETAPRALIWKNDSSSSKSGRKVSRLRNVSTKQSVRKSKSLSEKRDNAKAEAKSSLEPEAVLPPAAAPPAKQIAPSPAEQSSEQPTSATKPPRRKQRTIINTAETMRRREREFYGYNQDEKRPRFEEVCKSNSYLAEFESIRLATRIHE
jgi:hypothetical protein